MNTDLIELTIDDKGIATLCLNRPEKRNAFNDALRTQFIAALERIATDKDIRALILTGKGKGFSAGGDIESMAKRLEMPAGDVASAGWRRQQLVHRTQVLLYKLPIPTIAAVNGAAAGLGADTALACDFLIGCEDASFSWSYINRGLVADGGAMFLLPRRIGLSKAKELIFSGRRIDAQEALRLGVIDRIYGRESLLAEAKGWAMELSAGSHTAIALGKSILNRAFEQSIDDIFVLGSQAQSICYTTSAHREAVTEFLSGMGDDREKKGSGQ